MQKAKLFKNGNSQAVRLPKAFRFEGDEVFIKKVGDAIVLLPESAPWQTLFDSLDQFSDDFMTAPDGTIERAQPGASDTRSPLFD